MDCGPVPLAASHPWLAFGGNLQVSGQSVTLKPLDSLRQRVYLQPFGLWLTLDSGQFRSVALDEATHKVEITLAPGDDFTSAALLRIDQPAKLAGMGAFAPQVELEKVRGAYAVPLGGEPVVVHLSDHVSQAPQ